MARQSDGIDLHAQARPVGQVQVALANLASRRGDRVVEQELGREAMRERSQPAIASDRLQRVGCGGDPDRAVEGTRQVDGKVPRDLARRPDPAGLGELHGRERAGPELDRAPRVVGTGDAFVCGDLEPGLAREQRRGP